MGLHFSKEEFKSRKSKVLNSMKEQNIDALLMFRQESMYWLTGYDTFGYVFFQTLILDKNGNIILLTRAPDLRQAQNTSNIEDIRIWVDKDGSNPTDDLKIILDELNNAAISIVLLKSSLRQSKHLISQSFNSLSSLSLELSDALRVLTLFISSISLRYPFSEATRAESLMSNTFL